jgi:hypothetical protein
VSDDPITLPFVLSGSQSPTESDDLPEVSLVSSNLLDVSVESGDLSGLSGNLSDSYHASGLEPCIFSPSKVVRDLVESDEVSDFSAPCPTTWMALTTAMMRPSSYVQGGLIDAVFTRMS